MKPRVKPIHFLLTGVLLIVFALARAGVMSFTTAPQPRIAVEETAAAFGRIPTSQPVQHRFALSNSGKAPLLILGIKANCECTFAELSRKVLEAGQSTSIELTFTPKKPGERQQRVLVMTNDPDYPVTVLTLKATAYKPTTRATVR